MIHAIPKLLAAKLLLHLVTRLKTSRESRQVLHTAGSERLICHVTSVHTKQKRKIESFIAL